MNWSSIIAESVVGALFEILALGAIALFVIYKQRRALAQGKLEDVVLLSFNKVIDHQGEPLLAFRTPLTGSMQQIFFNESLIKEIKLAADNTTDVNPIVRLSDPKNHAMMLRGLINFSNQLNTAGQVAALTGQPFTESQHYLVLTYEPSAKTKMFRILIINQALFDEIERAQDRLTFSLPYHRERLTTLTALQAELIADASRPAMEKTLASFMIAAPITSSSAQII